MPDFRPCSTRLSHSQAPLCHCTLRLISAQAEGTFGRLRYFLVGDRPSQTTRQALSGTPIRGTVRAKVERVWHSTADSTLADARASKAPISPLPAKPQSN